jgi:hypothetical protein
MRISIYMILEAARIVMLARKGLKTVIHYNLTLLPGNFSVKVSAQLTKDQRNAMML